MNQPLLTQSMVLDSSPVILATGLSRVHGPSTPLTKVAVTAWRPVRSLL